MRVIGLVLLFPLVACVRHPPIATEAAAMRERLGDYSVVEIVAERGDKDTTTWAAHFDEAGDVRYIRERVRQGDSIAEDNEYWFEGRRLFAYMSRATPTVGSEEVVVYLGFDRAGGLSEEGKTVDGSPEPVQATEVAAAKAQAAFLEAAAERVLTRPAGATTPTFTTSPVYAGRMTLEGGKLRFLACGEAGRGVLLQDLPDDRGATLMREFGGAGTVLIRLDEDRLREIRYAATEGPGCDRLPREGDVRALGNEPFWSVRVDGAEALYRTPSEPDGVVFRDGTWSRAGEGPWVYRARRGSPSGVQHLTMQLTEAPCVDGMSGTRYPMKAVVMREAERVEGCAVERAGRARTEAR